jgi:hypothetical protein
MVTLAKGITSGVIPMGAVMVKSVIHHTFMKGRRERSSSSMVTPIPPIRWPAPPRWGPWTPMMKKGF